MTALLARIQAAWCNRWHRRISTPVNGEYICLECLRRVPVLWDRRESR